MTDNEARMLLDQSPIETAAKLVHFIGRPLAKSVAKFQVKSLASMKGYHGNAIAFWAEVLRKTLDANLQPLRCSEYDRARFTSIVDRMPGARG